MAQTRFHLSESGPKPCTATQRDCPIGGAHFATKEEADAAYEFKANKKFSPFAALKKKVDPYTKHVLSANERIKRLEPELQARDARQENGTLYHQLLADGVTKEELEARLSEEIPLRMAALTYTRTGEGENKAIGIGYGGDFKTEEEYGIAAIAKALAAGDYGPDDVRLYEKNGFTVLAIRGEKAHAFGEGHELDPIVSSEEGAFNRYGKSVPRGLQRRKWELESKKYGELREEFKDKISPLPKSKDELISAILKHENPNGARDNAVGEFQNGRALVIVTKDPLEAKVMKRLKESHDSGNLRVGNSANPFGRGTLFYDERDLSRELKSNLIREEEAHKAAKGYIAETQANLREAGGMLFSVSPRVSADITDIREARYWLNYAPAGRKQITGLFNKEELDKIAAKDYSVLNEETK